MKSFSTLSIIVIAFSLAACNQVATTQEQVLQQERSTTTQPTQLVNAALVDVLARADAFDGNEDHVVSKCSGCALHMDGDAENTVEVGDYEMHFCSEYCAENFQQDLESKLLALSIPEATP